MTNGLPRFAAAAAILLALYSVAVSQGSPQLVVQTGNDADISDIVFSQDGNLLLSSDLTGTVILWDLAGHQLRRFHEGTGFDDGSLAGVALSGDNKTIGFILVKSDGKERSTSTLIMRDIAGTGPAKRYTFRGEEFATVALSPSARWVFLGGGSAYKDAYKDKASVESCILWDAVTGQIVRRITNCMSGAFSPDGETLSTLSQVNGKDVVYVRHLPDMREISHAQPLDAHSAGILVSSSRLTYSPDGRRLIRWEVENGSHIAYDARTGKPETDLVQKPGSESDGRAIPISMFNNYTISPDTRILAWDGSDGGTQGVYDNTIYVVEYSTGKDVVQLGRTSPIAQMVRATGPAANKILIVDLLGDGYVWDLDKGIESARLVQPVEPDPNDGTTDGDEGRGGTGQSALPDGAISTNGRYVMIAPLGPFFGGALIWNGETGQLMNTMNFLRPSAKDPEVADDWGAESTDILESQGRILIQGCGTLKLLDMFREKTFWTLETSSNCGSQGDLRSDRDLMRLSANGTVALVGKFDSETGSAALVDVKTGRVLQKYPGMEGLPVAISPDGRTGAIAHFYGPYDDGRKENTVLFKTGTRAVIKKFAFAVRALSFSPDGRQLLLLSTDRLVLADTRTGITVGSAHLDDVVANDVTFSPDGDFAIVATSEGSARFYRTGPVMSEVCRIFSLSDGNWVVVDPEGRFDTNNIETIKGLVWIAPDQPLRPLPLEIFSRQYFEPGLLARILKCNKEGTCDKEFKPLPSIAKINRVQPRVAKPNVSMQNDK